MTADLDAADALTEVSRLVDYIRITIGAAAADAAWVAAGPLVREPDVLYEAMRTTMDGRGIERDDIGMSLLVQGYAFRIASVSVGSWLVGGGVVDVSPANVEIQFSRHRPNAVRLDHARWIGAPSGPDLDWAALHRHLVDEHLAVIIDTARRACRVGARMLWSNVASSCASSFGAFMAPMHDRAVWVRAMAQQFFATARGELAAGGEVVPIGPVWAWQRHACCLYYQHTGGSRCGDCSLFTLDERRERYARILAEVDR